MRTALTTLVFTAGVLLAAPASVATASSTVTGQVLPEVVPPGAVVTVDVFGCPTGTTTIEIALGPQGSPASMDDSAAAVEGAATFTELLSTDAAVGTWVVGLWCYDDGATEVDTGQLSFVVSSSLGLTLSPSSGPAGTRATASGSGCPTGRTEMEVLWLIGAGDELPAWDPLRPGVTAPPNPDGSFSVPFTVPQGTEAGELLVVVWCVSEGGSALAGPFVRAFVVTEGGTVPTTGSSTPSLLAAAGLLVIAGLAMGRVGRVS